VFCGGVIIGIIIVFVMGRCQKKAPTTNQEFGFPDENNVAIPMEEVPISREIPVQSTIPNPDNLTMAGNLTQSTSTTTSGARQTHRIVYEEGYTVPSGDSVDNYYAKPIKN
jgi:hypothetical protein